MTGLLPRCKTREYSDKPRCTCGELKTMQHLECAKLDQKCTVEDIEKQAMSPNIQHCMWPRASNTIEETQLYNILYSLEKKRVVVNGEVGKEPILL